MNEESQVRDGNEALVVLCTAPEALAADLARKLVEHGLAACVQRYDGLRSTYRWEGRIEESVETLLLIKSRASRFAELRERLAAWHPYEVPEILALPVSAGHEPYLAWLRQATAAPA